VARPSPITVAVFVLTVVPVVAAAFLVFRPRHRHETASIENVAEEPAPPPALPEAPAVIEKARVHAAPPAAEPVAEPVAPAPPPAQVQGTPLPEDTMGVFKRRTSLIAAHRKQLLDEADERVFTTMNIPESTRSAVRKINEEFGKRLEVLPTPDQRAPNTAQGSNPSPDSYDGAREARRAAIGGLLDSESAQAFERAEHTAEADLRAHYRRSWNKELRASAPFPSGQALEAQ
jgi:hypothetical protein